MLGKSIDQTQQKLFQPHLKDFIDKEHELVLLADQIDWKHFEDSFSARYSRTGKPSMPVRLMVGCLLLKRMYNLGDETLAEAWVMNPYMQYFTGAAHFHHSFPCDPSDFVHFRKRIGEEGVETIFVYSVKLHGSATRSKMVLSDTTVQENNTTFPTDAKLAKKVMDKCNAIAKAEGLAQRQTYRRVGKQLLRDTHNSQHPKRQKKARAAGKKLRTCAGRLLRELERTLSPEALSSYKPQLDMYQKVIGQKRGDTNKIYSLHKPFTCCIAKGKAHKPYEFGNKVGLVIDPKTLVVTAIDSFEGNPHDSNTIEPLLQQLKKNFDQLPTELIYDRGGRGKKEIDGVKISTPSKPLKRDSASQKKTRRNKFRRRAAIEPVIGHLKSDCRMEKNYLSGKKSPKMNAMLAAAGWNFKKLIEKIRKESSEKLAFIFQRFLDRYFSALAVSW